MRTTSTNKDEPTTVMVGGFPILRTTASALVPVLQEKMQQQQIALFFANTNFVVQCQSLKSHMSDSSTIIVNDGIGMDIACRITQGFTFIENLNGTDFTPLFLRSLGTQARVFLLGAKPGIAQRAAQSLADNHQVNVVGISNGYDEAKDVQALINTINNSHSNILVVAMGNPQQEQWILQHRHKLNVQVLMGVGALFDFLAGDKARAPAIVQKIRMEWFYRMCLEPKRLMRRYTIDIFQFLALCLNQNRKIKAEEYDA
jgi:beta-1,4-glucosyltransferase